MIIALRKVNAGQDGRPMVSHEGRREPLVKGRADAPQGGTVNGTAPRQVTARGDLVVVMTCQVCGRHIRLVAGDLGPELEDTQAFLAAHAQCLHARWPEPDAAERDTAEPDAAEPDAAELDTAAQDTAAQEITSKAPRQRRSGRQSHGDVGT
jgi:hypothetical protein